MGSQQGSRQRTVLLATLTDVDRARCWRIQHSLHHRLGLGALESRGVIPCPAGERGKALERVVVDVEAGRVHLHAEEGDGADADADEGEGRRRRWAEGDVVCDIGRSVDWGQ